MSSLAVDLLYLLPPGACVGVVYIIRHNYLKSLVSDSKFKPLPKQDWIGDDVAGQQVGKEIAAYTASPPKPKVYESFGHPAPPILLLKASMPSAPIGYAWEITTGINDAGNPALKLAMLNMKTGLVIDSIEGDLVIIRRWTYAKDDTYADFYRRCEEKDRVAILNEQMAWRQSAERQWERQMQSIPEFKSQTEKGLLAGKVMLANLITPIVDWAALITLRYIVEHPDEKKCNYELIEGVSA